MSDLFCSAVRSAELGEDPARRLIVHAPHPDTVGNPVLKRDLVLDLIDLLRREVNTDD